jgi:osmoprotectant transport system permease protein
MRKILFLMLLIGASASAQTIRVGAKHFNEGYILSEMLSLLLEEKGYTVERKYNLGGTMVCFEALRTGAIDLYPEYSGTISAELLKDSRLSISASDSLLRRNFAIETGALFGFNNTYALVMQKSVARKKNISRISDLSRYPELVAGISYEFLKRVDGWDQLSQIYELPQQPSGLEHGLAYQALVQNRIDVTDAYSTDGEIASHDLLLLRDDKEFFPEYQALTLLRSSLDPAVKNCVNQLQGSISETEMQALNGAVLYQKKTFNEVASAFLVQKGLIKSSFLPESVAQDMAHKIWRHLALTFVALILAILIAVPLGIFLFWHPRLATGVVSFIGLLQTIPSIALLAIFIPVFGIGVIPAVIALLLYALLPIVRNTVTGLSGVDPLLKNVSDGLGMTRLQKLRIVELPLALPVILAGIRTAAVINVGTATLAAFIGAGGLGEYIVTGLALNNTSLILRGAIPAALLALVVELGFTAVEKITVPKHLR